MVEEPGPVRITVSVAQARFASQREGVYVISVASRLLEMHPQTLRKYERVGLVAPSRTEGLLRLYSEQDITRLRMVKHLVDHWGMNLAGVEATLGLLDELMGMQQRLQPLMSDNAGVDTVFREAWAQVFRSLRLPQAGLEPAAPAPDQDVPGQNVEESDGPSGGARARGRASGRRRGG
ncbi:MAG: MerR family transcriptional regulator [Dehalococcoidia bacterium]|nr:MerR family transcriptional regulator [Dehalococcoidia bacterium]